MVWLCKTKIRRKSKIMLHRYGELHSLHKRKRIYVGTEKDLILQIMNKKERSLTKWKNKKSNCINERWIKTNEWREVNKITFCADSDKRIQSIDSVATYAYETSKVHKFLIIHTEY